MENEPWSQIKRVDNCSKGFGLVGFLDSRDMVQSLTIQGMKKKKLLEGMRGRGVNRPPVFSIVFNRLT